MKINIKATQGIFGLFVFIFSFIALLPLVAAQVGDLGRFTITYLFESYTAKFTIMLLFFFVIGYYAFKKTFGTKNIAMVLAMLVAFIITNPVLEHFEDTLFNQAFVRIIVIALGVVGAITLISFIYSLFTKKLKGFKFRWACWIVVVSYIMYIAEWLPFSYVSSTIENIWITLTVISGCCLFYLVVFSSEAVKKRGERKITKAGQMRQETEALRSQEQLTEAREQREERKQTKKETKRAAKLKSKPIKDDVEEAEIVDAEIVEEDEDDTVERFPGR